MIVLVLALVALFALTRGAGGGPPATAGAAAPGAVATTAAPSSEVVTTQAPPPAASGPIEAALGEGIDIVCNGTPCMTVTVDKVSFASRYVDPSGFLNDAPKASADEFMAVHVTYRATGPNADYNEYDWAVYADNVAVSGPALVLHGPTPQLSSALNLPQGKSAVGWFVYEVPRSGTLTVSYEPGRNGSIFEVTARP